MSPQDTSLVIWSFAGAAIFIFQSIQDEAQRQRYLQEVKRIEEEGYEINHR